MGDVAEEQISDVVDNELEQVNEIEDANDEENEVNEVAAKEVKEEQNDIKEIVKQEVYLEEEAKYIAAKELVKQEVYLEEEAKYLADPDGCPMDSQDVFQMKLYWEKGTEWQGSKREKAWCAECEDDCDSGEQVRIKEYDEDEKEQFWIFDKCS